MASELILHVQDHNGQFFCRQFSGFPSPTPVYIAICFAGNPGSAQMASDLIVKIETGVKRFDANITETKAPCGGFAHNYFQCQVMDNPDCKKILIAVSDGQFSNFNVHGILQWPHIIIPVMKRGQFIQLPVPLNSPQVAFWNNDIAEILPDIWGIAGVSDRATRIFISYKKDDTSPLAEQLYTELDKAGFDVFLDRFSINVGVNFQNRLFQELSDKAMVLLLESPKYQQSQWVKYEIAFAKKYRLGLFALNCDHAPTVPALDDEYREKLTATDFNPDGTLQAHKLPAILGRIKDEHAKSLFRKRYYLQSNIFYFLKKRNLSFMLDQRGFVETMFPGTNNKIKIWAVPRPPDLEDFYHSDTSNTQPYINVIVGPKFKENRRAVLNGWISGKASIHYFRESQIKKLANNIANGSI